jgi:CubicO group peptidase (beta-lactamase class C family)
MNAGKIRHLGLMAIIITTWTNISTQNLDSSILAKIYDRAAETHSDALIVIHKGEVLIEDYFGQRPKPIYIASAGKSLVSLAIGKLLDLGMLDSLEQPVHTLFSEWRQGRKKDITVEMLLNHTSGLQNHPNASVELEPPPDYKVDNVIKLALAAEIDGDPGTAVRYNNKAVALLGGIIEVASGLRMDAFFEKHFFQQMDIEEIDWIRDRAGNPTAHGAFVIRPRDLAKFGEMILAGGKYGGEQIISKEWLRRSFQGSQPYTPIWGLLWWRLPEYERRVIDEEIWQSWQDAGVDAAWSSRLKPLVGQTFTSKEDFFQALTDRLGSNWPQQVLEHLPPGIELSRRIYSDKIVAYYADGFRGNYLVVAPHLDLVAVRCADHDGFNYETDSFSDFLPLVRELLLKSDSSGSYRK